MADKKINFTKAALEALPIPPPENVLTIMILKCVAWVLALPVMARNLLLCIAG